MNAPTGVHFETSCGIVPFRRLESGLEFLLLHSALVRNPDAAWEFPKGAPNEGETETETALRELEEETTVVKIELLTDYRDQVRYHYRRDGRDIDKTIVFFTGEVIDWSGIPFSPPTHEHVLHPKSGQWHVWSEESGAYRLLFHPGMRALLDRTARFIREFDRIAQHRS